MVTTAKSRRPSLRVTLTAALAIASLGGTQAASADVTERHADLETGDLSEFDQATAATGTLVNSGERAASGTRSARAQYGGGGANGYARGTFDVQWPADSDVTYSSSFFLPSGFKASMQGQVALLRWDNWPSFGATADFGGVVIYGADKRARLVRGSYTGDQVAIVGPFDVPEGRWFTLTVRQRLSSSNPISEVWLDGAPVGSSTAQNSNGRAVERMRYGLVAIAAGVQLNPLTLWLDDAGVIPTVAAPAPDPTPPAPAPPPTANLAPSVALTQPSEGSSFKRNLTMAANAADDRGVARVEFRVDGKLEHTDTSVPYAWTWSRAAFKLAPGWHQVEARAFDAEGLSASDSASVKNARSSSRRRRHR